MAPGEEDKRLSPLIRTPAFPLEGQRIESAAALQGKEDPGMGSDTPVAGGSFLGLVGTPSAPQLGLSPPESLLSPKAV